MDKEELRILKMREADGLKSNDHEKPIGKCLPLLFFENCQSGVNNVFLTEAIREVGGWPETHLKAGYYWSIWLKMLAYGYNIDVITNVLYHQRFEQAIKSRPAMSFEIDQVNLGFIQQMVDKRPDFYYNNCIISEHRLLRYYLIGQNPVIYELNLIKGSTLYSIGVKLDDLARRNMLFKKLLMLSGAGIKKILN